MSSELDMLICDTIHIYPSLDDDFVPTFNPIDVPRQVLIPKNIVPSDVVDNVYSNFEKPVFQSETLVVKEELSENSQVDDLPSYHQHEVDPLNDNLQRLAIMYHVEIDEIKAANGLYSPGISLDFFPKKYITIPGPKRILSRKPPGVECKEIEERKRHWAMQFFIGLKGVPKLVAQCYLEVNNYDFKKAVQEYEADLEWDLAHQDKKEKKVEKKKRQIKTRLLNKLSLKYPIMSLFTCCFSLNYLQTLEMDQVLDQ